MGRGSSGGAGGTVGRLRAGQTATGLTITPPAPLGVAQVKEIPKEALALPEQPVALPPPPTPEPLRAVAQAVPDEAPLTYEPPSADSWTTQLINGQVQLKDIGG